MEEESCAPTDLSGRIHAFCREQKEKRKQEWESHKIALDVMKESKEKHLKQLDKKEREIIYSQMAQTWKKQEMWSEIPYVKHLLFQQNSDKWL